MAPKEGTFYVHEGEEDHATWIAQAFAAMSLLKALYSRRRSFPLG